MPQFMTTGRGDVAGAVSKAFGDLASRGTSMGTSAGVTSKIAEKKAKTNNPAKLAYWMQKTGGRKNAAYTLWKRQTKQRPGKAGYSPMGGKQ